jgi:hypothetical protein
MKKLQLIAALMTLIFFGCSEQSNPVGPAQSSRFGPASTIAGDKKDGVQPWKTAIQLALSEGDTNIVSVSQLIMADSGGSVRLCGAFPDKHGDSVSYDLSITFPAGALPYDATISISIDKNTFADNGLVTFGPHGLVFNTPGTLLLNATNIDFVKKNKTVNLYYDNNGVYQPMPDGWGSVTKILSSTSVTAGAQIPHFSMYAFGR